METLVQLNELLLRDLRDLDTFWAGALQSGDFGDPSEDEVAAELKNKIDDMRETIVEFSRTLPQERSSTWYQRLLYVVISPPAPASWEFDKRRQTRVLMANVLSDMKRTTIHRAHIGPLAYKSDMKELFKPVDEDIDTDGVPDYPGETLPHQFHASEKPNLNDQGLDRMQSFMDAPLTDLPQWWNAGDAERAASGDEGTSRASQRIYHLETDLKKMAKRLVAILDRCQSMLMDEHIKNVKQITCDARDLLILFTRHFVDNEDEVDVIRLYVERTIPVVFALSRFLDSAKSNVLRFDRERMGINAQLREEARFIRRSISNLHTSCMNHEPYLSTSQDGSKIANIKNGDYLSLPSIQHSTDFSDEMIGLLRSAAWGDQSILEEIDDEQQRESGDRKRKKINDELEADKMLSNVAIDDADKLDYVKTVFHKLNIQSLAVLEADLKIQIGDGSWGSVHPTMELGGSAKLAVKLMKEHQPRDVRLKAVLHEARVWSRLKSHENILELLGYAIFTNKSDPGLVSRWCEHGSLRDYIGKFDLPMEVKLKLAKDVASGLQGLHAMNIRHGDIRPANILVSNEGRALICDFGLSSVLEEPSEGNATLTNDLWLAPELRHHSAWKGDKKMTEHTDMYAYGWLLYEVLTCNDPNAKLQARIDLSYEVNQKLGPTDDIDEEHWDLLWDLWNVIPECRPRAFLVIHRLRKLMEPL